AMEERQVTVEGVTHKLPAPFMVRAAQNPIESEGTFPLPEAQLDRFLIRVHLGYPSPTDEVLVMERQQLTHPGETVEQVTDATEILQVQTGVKDLSLVTLGYRIIMSPGAKVKGTTVADVVAACLGRVPVPGARARV